MGTGIVGGVRIVLICEEAVESEPLVRLFGACNRETTILPFGDVWISAIRSEDTLNVVIAAIVCCVIGVNSIVVVLVVVAGTRPAVHRVVHNISSGICGVAS